MTALYYAFIAGLAVGFLVTIAVISVMAISTMGEDDPSEPHGYVDQDHHGHCAINRDHDGESTPARHQWRNSSVHRPHVQD